MEPELEGRLRNASKEHLASLMQELALRHPVLLTEMLELLGHFTDTTDDEGEEEGDTEIESEATENWDFNGDDDDMVELHSVPRPVLPPLDLESKRQHVNSYGARLQQGESQQSIGSDVSHLLQEAQAHADQHDYQGALDLYTLILDTRLAEQNIALIQIFDKAVDESMPFLEALLNEISSSITFDASISLSPLLTHVMRHTWLERLFALWLKRLDLHQKEEGIPEIMLDIAWNDDVALLRNLVQKELQQLGQDDHSNIVDFSRQYRIRTLEKFLKELLYL